MALVLSEELDGLIAALEDARLEYALAGGLAVAVWGAPRATKDIDLLVPPEQVDAIRAVARGRGFLLEAGPITFRDGMELRRRRGGRAGGCQPYAGHSGWWIAKL